MSLFVVEYRVYLTTDTDAGFSGVVEKSKTIEDILNMHLGGPDSTIVNASHTVRWARREEKLNLIPRKIHMAVGYKTMCRYRGRTTTNPTEVTCCYCKKALAESPDSGVTE